MKASDNLFPKLLFTEGAAPAAPAANTVIAYAKADGKLYSKDDAGTETPLGGAGGVKIVTTITSGTITPAGDTDLLRPAALSAALTIANPSSTPADGWPMVLEIKDNGTSRALTWDSRYADRVASLPSATTAGKQHVIVVSYNAADDKLYCDAATVQS